ncbi:MAG: hypothetical protein GXO07_04495 [Crenarchaeota archaeon]|nr:hypothetical protein [Thermoproteota archaeon]
MKGRVHSITRTGLYVIEIESSPPRIGSKVEAGKFRGTVVDVIGPAGKPFLIVKGERGKLEKDEVVKIEVKKRR